MRAKAGVQLVIDASVAAHAGSREDPDESSVPCRRFLDAVLETRMRFVLTDAIEDEWTRNAGLYAKRWLRLMHGQHCVEPVDPAPLAGLDRRLQSAGRRKRDREAMLKDRHLIEAAVAADRRVCSADEEVRRLCRVAAAQVNELRGVVWVNPNLPDDTCEEWLRAGAPDERHRRLGFGGEEAS